MIVIERTVDLSQPIQTETLRGNEFTGEQLAHTFRIGVTQGGEPVTLSGVISAKFLNAVGDGLLLTGSVVNNAAEISLVQACYGVPGRFHLGIYHTLTTAGGTETVCIYSCVGAVVNATGDPEYDPGDAIGSIETLLDRAEDAAEDAESALAQATNIVSYAEQTGKTEAEKEQARKNIGCAITAIASPTDANSLIIPGLYAYGSGTAPANLPVRQGQTAATYGVLEVSKAGTYIHQRYTNWAGIMFARRRNADGTTWTTWAPFMPSEALAIGTENLNNLLRTGTFSYTTGTAPANWPNGRYGTLFVEAATGNAYVTQMVIDYDRHVFVRRMRAANDWAPWTMLATEMEGIPQTAGYYITLSGTTADINNPSASTAGFSYSLVECKAGDVFTINAKGGSGPRAYGFVAADGTVLQRADAAVTLSNYVVVAPAKSAYLVINNGTTTTSYVGAIGWTGEDLPQCLYKSFQRVGVIGDSLSVGYAWNKAASTATTRMLAYSWPKIIGRECGVPWLNLGTSGQNVITWCSSDTYGKVQLEASGNKCQMYIIGLGENDASDSARHVDLGTTADIVDNPATVATTFYGGYNRIIQLIKQLNPTAKIICLTNANKNTTGRPREDYSAAVRYIATQHYTTADNVYLIDLEADYDKFFGLNSPIRLDGETITSHYSPAGYEMIAEYMRRAINRVIYQNHTDFINIAYIPCDTGTPTANTMTE